MKGKGLDISEGSMTGKEIKTALDLRVGPRVVSSDKNYIFVMQSESLDTIEEKYNEISSDRADEDEEDLISLLAKYLKKLKEAQWQNSIDELPEGNSVPHNNMLLLWKLDQEFTDKFCIVPECSPPLQAETTPPSQANTTSPRRRSARSASKTESAAANLTKDFDT